MVIDNNDMCSEVLQANCVARLATYLEKFGTKLSSAEESELRDRILFFM